MNILMTGATGFIGGALIDHFRRGKNHICVQTRDKGSVTDKSLEVIDSLDGIANDREFDVIINLAGAPISKRWSESYKKILIESRVKVTESVCQLIKKLDRKPSVFISASAVGYYGGQGDTVIDEQSNPCCEFTHQLCKQWEHEALQAQKCGVKVVIARLGVVLGKGQGILKKTVPPFKFGLGGKIGSGTQYLSWIHIDDVVNAFDFFLRGGVSGGVYNVTAPTPVTNHQWTQLLSQALHRPALLPMPGVLVKFLFGEMGESLLLSGQRVVPRKLTAEGFIFKYKTLGGALSAIFRCDTVN